MTQSVEEWGIDILEDDSATISEDVAADSDGVEVEVGSTFTEHNAQDVLGVEVDAGSIPNVLSIGTVTTGEAGGEAEATIRGSAPNQILDLTIPEGNIGPSGLVMVNHGADATVARPNAPLVYWIGSVLPNNASATDLWYDNA